MIEKIWKFDQKSVYLQRKFIEITRKVLNVKFHRMGRTKKMNDNECYQVQNRRLCTECQMVNRSNGGAVP